MRKKCTGPGEWRADRGQRARSGAAAVVVAIVLPIFLMLLFGIIQFGSVLFLHNNMVNAARETARRMAVDESFEAAQAQSYAETYLSDWNLNFSFAIVPPPEIGRTSCRERVCQYV